jgi:hypothetical protein
MYPEVYGLGGVFFLIVKDLRGYVCRGLGFMVEDFYFIFKCERFKRICMLRFRVYGFFILV